MNESLTCYLTPLALQLVSDLETAGIARDLAIECVDIQVKLGWREESEIYLNINEIIHGSQREDLS